MVIFVLIAILVIIAAVASFAVYFVMTFEDRLRNKAVNALEVVSDEPDRARQMAQQIQSDVKAYSNEKKLGENGRYAQALSYVVLALVSRSRREADQHLSKLRKLSRRQTSEAAEVMVEFYLVKDPDCIDAVECYLDCLEGQVEQETYDRIFEALQTACEVAPDMRVVDLKHKIKWNKQAQKTFGNQRWPVLNISNAYHQLGHPASAQQILTDHLKHHPDASAVRVALARSLRLGGNRAAAQHELNAVLEQRLDQKSYFAVVWELIVLGDLHKAAELIQKIQTQDRPDLEGRVYGLYGIIRLREGNYPDAINYLVRSLKLVPENDTVRLALAEAYTQAGNSGDAVRLLQQAVQVRPDDAQFQFALGSALFNAKQWVDAGKCFAVCIRQDFRPRTSTLLWARCALGNGLPTEAWRVLNESHNLDTKDSEVAFYRGVALYQSNDPKKAVPEFVRAFNGAKKVGDKARMSRAKTNVCAAYGAAGNQRVQEENYTEAAQIYDILLQNLSSTSATYNATKQVLAECYVRASVQLFERSGGSGSKAALPVLEKGIALFPKPAARYFQAGLLCKEGRYADGAAIFLYLINQKDHPEFRFGWALATSKSQSPAEGLAQLEGMIRQGGPVAVRAALVLAGKEADRGQKPHAAKILEGALATAEANRSPWYSEACCQAVLHAFQGGDEKWAVELSKKYASQGGLPSELIVGALKADSGDYEGAVAEMEKAIPQVTDRERVVQPLMRVYKMAAKQAGQKKNFEQLVRLTQRALQCGEDRDIRLLYDLANATELKSTNEDEFDEDLLRMLSHLCQSAQNADAPIIRSTLIAYHQKAFVLAMRGDHYDAEPYWERANQLWLGRIRKQGEFWKGYVSNYNSGKKYDLQSSEEELEDKVAKRLAGVCIGLSIRSLKEYDFRNADYYWAEGVRLARTEACRELFNDMANVNEILSNIDFVGEPDLGYDLFLFLSRNIDPDDEHYQEQLDYLEILKGIEEAKHGNYGLLRRMTETATKKIREFACQRLVRESIQALLVRNVYDFKKLLDVAGEFDREWRRTAKRVRRLPEGMINRITNEYESHPLVRRVRDRDPDAADEGLFRMIQLFGDIDTEHRGRIPIYVIRDIVNEVIPKMHGKA
ncbi:MAG: tetratricopeptide repeat protein [Gemmataceae bacterium]